MTALTLLVGLAGCGVNATPTETGDAAATTVTTAVADGAVEPTVPPGGLADGDPALAETVETSTSTTAPGGQQTQGPPQAGPDVGLARTELGEVLVDSDGLTLYAYTGDTEGVPTCDAACADMWPPALADDDLTLPASLDDDTFTVVDGTYGPQLKVGRWPLYLFAADMPGEARGQGMADAFYAVAADGALVRP